MYDAHFAATNGPMLFFRADNDKAISPAATQAFWDGYGVIRQFSPAYTPNRNGRSESSIRTGYMVARALIRDSPVPDLLWPYAVQSRLLHSRASSDEGGADDYPVGPSDWPPTGTFANRLGLRWALDAPCGTSATKQATHFQL